MSTNNWRAQPVARQTRICVFPVGNRVAQNLMVYHQYHHMSSVFLQDCKFGVLPQVQMHPHHINPPFLWAVGPGKGQMSWKDHPANRPWNCAKTWMRPGCEEDAIRCMDQEWQTQIWIYKFWRPFNTWILCCKWRYLLANQNFLGGYLRLICKLNSSS